MRVQALLLIGPTGSGKTPLGEHLERAGMYGRRCFHFDFGSQLRAIAESDAAPEGFTQAEHLFVRDVLEKGLLLENEHFPVAEKIVNRFLVNNRMTDDDILILNGLPRHREQALDMERLVRVIGLIVLECTACDVHSRIRENSGNDRDGRTDDGVEMVRKKLLLFNERTAPLVGHYSSSGRPICRIPVDASASARDLYANLLAMSSASLVTESR